MPKENYLGAFEKKGEFFNTVFPSRCCTARANIEGGDLRVEAWEMYQRANVRNFKKPSTVEEKSGVVCAERKLKGHRLRLVGHFGGGGKRQTPEKGGGVLFPSLDRGKKTVQQIEPFPLKTLCTNLKENTTTKAGGKFLWNWEHIIKPKTGWGKNNSAPSPTTPNQPLDEGRNLHK